MTREEAVAYFKRHIDLYCVEGICREAEEMAIKAIEQQPCEDYIKVPKNTLKYRESGIVAYNYEWLKEHFDTEKELICGKQEPCEDAISRQGVIDTLTKTGGIRGDALKALYDLPSVQPKQKTGQWIETGAEELPFGVTLKELTCSECGWNSTLMIPRNYCPKCGMKIEGGKE